MHPNIPKPLHGVSPRTIEGEEWWEKERRLTYARYDYHCIACGVVKHEARKHHWLEAHEYWQIDYNTGICRVDSIEPLCHYCHNFIHSGRLAMILGKEKTKVEVVEILEHGFEILAGAKLDCFPGTWWLAERLSAYTYGVMPYRFPDEDIAWNEWKLLWNGKEYHSPYKDFWAWQEHYKGGNNEF